MAKHHLSGKTTELQATKFFKVLLKYSLSCKMKYSKQIWMLSINKLYKNIEDTRKIV